MKKLLAVLLAAALVFGLMACGGGGSDTTTKAADTTTKAASTTKAADGTTKAADTTQAEEEVEVKTIKLFLGSMNTIPAEDAINVVEEYIDDYVNNTLGIKDLKLDMDIVAIADMSTQIGLMLAGGEELDIISSWSLSTYVANGYMVDLTPYKDTTLKETFEELGDWMIGTKINGCYYAIPVKKGNVLAAKFFYDHAYFDSVCDIDDITDLDTLGDAMAKLKEAYPNEHFLVYLDVTNYYTVQDHTCAVGTYCATIGKDTSLVSYYGSEAFEKSVRKAYEWNNLGYGDPEGSANTLSHDALVLGGSSKGVIMGHAYSEETCDLMFDTNSGGKIDFGCKTLWTSDLTGIAGTVGIAYTSKHVEAATRFLNLIYTDEFIASAIIYGKEGVSWEWNADHSSIVYPEGLDLATVPYTCLYLCGAFGNQFKLYGMDGNTSEADKTYMQELIDNAFVAPYFGFAPDASPVQTQVASLANVANQYRKPITYGELDPDEYLPKFLKELDDAGLQDVIKEYQAQGTAWLAENGK